MSTVHGKGKLRRWRDQPLLVRRPLQLEVRIDRNQTLQRIEHWYSHPTPEPTFNPQPATFASRRKQAVVAFAICVFSAGAVVHLHCDTLMLMDYSARNTASRTGNGLDLERPKVVKCASTGKYVMWVRGTGYGNTPQLVGVATADSPTGPFSFEGNKTDPFHTIYPGNRNLYAPRPSIYKPFRPPLLIVCARQQGCMLELLVLY